MREWLTLVKDNIADWLPNLMMFDDVFIPDEVSVTLDDGVC